MPKPRLNYAWDWMTFWNYSHLIQIRRGILGEGTVIWIQSVPRPNLHKKTIHERLTLLIFFGKPRWLVRLRSGAENPELLGTHLFARTFTKRYRYWCHCMVYSTALGPAKLTRQKQDSLFAIAVYYLASWWVYFKYNRVQDLFTTTHPKPNTNTAKLL